MLRLGVLVSFRGSNLQAVIDAIRGGQLRNAEISVVIANKECGAVERARKAGLKTIIIPSKGRTREEYDEELIKALEAEGVDLVVLAGFFRILSPKFVRHYRNRTLNLHPSLLPAFPGGCSNAQKRALEWGVKVTGCSVHFVDEGEDRGPLIVQKAVRVEEGDDEESLSARIRVKEHEALLEAIQLIADERVEVKGRRVHIK